MLVKYNVFLLNSMSCSVSKDSQLLDLVKLCFYIILSNVLQCIKDPICFDNDYNERSNVTVTGISPSNTTIVWSTDNNRGNLPTYLLRKKVNLNSNNHFFINTNVVSNDIFCIFNDCVWCVYVCV